jgi:hypothetical protein
LKNAIKFYTENPIQYYMRGLSKGLLKDKLGAIADYTMAIEFDYQYAAEYLARERSKIDLGQEDSGCLDLSNA